MRMKKILQLGTIAGIILAVAVFMVFYRPVPLAGDTHYLVVQSGSMEPALPVGSVVIIKPVDPNKLQKNEIICFKLSGPQSITHRIIDVTDNGFITKGDANNASDNFVVEKKDVIGKVVLTIPYVGYLNHFVKTPLGFTLLIVLPATIIIAGEMRNIINHHKTTSEQRNEIASSTRREQ